MARVLYGNTPADFTLGPSGRIIPNVSLTVWDAASGGTQVTDLLDYANAPVSTVTSDDSGLVRFYAPDGTDSTLWIQSGSSTRLAVRPVNLPRPDLEIGTVTTGTADVTLTPNGLEGYTMDLVLPSAGANGVNTAAIQDDAVTAAKIAANAVGSSELADNAVDTAAIATGAVTAEKFAVQPGNLFTDNQASGTDTLGDTTGFLVGGSATIARSTTYAASGAGSLAATSLSGTTYGFNIGTPGDLASMPVVTAGDTYTFTVQVRCSTARTVTPRIYWRDAAGGAVSTSTGPSVAAGSSAFVEMSMTATAPATAAYVCIEGGGSAVAADEVLYFDEFSFHKGAGGVWALPGVPIPGQSRIAVNNAVDLSGTGLPEGVITAAPGSTFLQTDSTTDVKGWIRWVKATGTGSTGWVAGPEADTGWRLVTASMSGWAGTNWMRRIGSQVTFQINATRSSDGGNYNGYTTLITAPTGFSPAGYLTAGLASTPVGLGYIWNTNGLTSIDVSAGFSGTWATGGSCYGQATWLTNAAWPSSLPGSAVV